MGSLLLTACGDAGSQRPVLAAAPENPPVNPARAQTAQPTPTAVSPASLTYWISPEVPVELAQSMALPEGMEKAETEEKADVRLQVVENTSTATRWVYALVAPFPTITDGVRLQELKNAWKGKSEGVFKGHTILVTADTKAAFTRLWGNPAGDGVREVSSDLILSTAWVEKTPWAIIPFENLEARWKVLRVDGHSPMDREFEWKDDPLTVPFGWEGNEEALSLLEKNNAILLPASNRDPAKLTVLVMTGTTALVRSIGARMEQKGMTYPAGDIKDWLQQADILHISNEIAFDPECPNADFFSHSLRFCSRPEYFDLLDYVGMDVVELSGNHVLDWSKESFEYTLQMYRDHNIPYFAGGENIADGQKPVKMEHNGNKIAFLGCNKGGPPQDWATETTPGAVPCDYDQMKATIQSLLEEGYLPVVTFQYNETYGFQPVPTQKIDFPEMAKTGAVIVSGSQSHFPMSMTFAGSHFIHYGLGNLFFDQMDLPVKGTRREFIDRHVFYNGKYLGVELLTAMLEDYSRPRPMTEDERSALLGDAFVGSGWMSKKDLKGVNP